MRAYFQLTKIGITVFVLLSGLIGYALSFRMESEFDIWHILATVAGLYFLSAGSLALNQIQDQDIDLLMKRTKSRPLVSGVMSARTATLITLSHLVLGVALLAWVSAMAAWVGVATVVLYNVIYTMWWKRHMAYAAVPGAIPGSLPVVIGYAANSPQILNLDCLYVFLVMFFWQMPHFWALALRFKDDYAAAGVPVLPVIAGKTRTLNQMAIYMFLYVLLALTSPLYVVASWFYLVAVVPMAFKAMLEFVRYYREGADQTFLRFFMWVNLSMLLFLVVPVADKWAFLVLPEVAF